MPIQTETAVPALTNREIVLGCIKHLPAYDDIPEAFKNEENPFVEFVHAWYYGGLKIAYEFRPRAKDGVNRVSALDAIHAVLASPDPQFHHKIAGAAYLAAQWLTVEMMQEAA